MTGSGGKINSLHAVYKIRTLKKQFPIKISKTVRVIYLITDYIMIIQAD